MLVALRAHSKYFHAVLCVAGSVLLGVVPAHSTEKLLHAFQGGSDGVLPQGPLIHGNDGYFYGTTTLGGSSACGGSGCGTTYKIASDGTEKVVYAFQGGNDGAGPWGSLLKDKSGDFFGATLAGGNACSLTDGCGTVYRLTPDGTEQVLYAFQGGSDGLVPRGNLVEDKNGNLYGVTTEGGNYNGSTCSQDGCGTVFEIQPDGTKLTLYTFQGGSDGGLPAAGLIMDTSGNLYGTTSLGGTCEGNPDGCGTVFKVTPSGSESVLYSFCQQANCTDGAYPYAPLIMDSAGNLLGTTFGGATGCNCGTVFEVASGGAESVLYAFQGGSDGSNPEAGLVMDKTGNLYGTTYYGGGTGCKATGIGCGTVFQLAPNGTETVLFAFSLHRGAHPVAELLKGLHGRLYGTATIGGASNDGVVFGLKK